MNNHLQRISFSMVLVWLSCCLSAFAQRPAPRDEPAAPLVAATASNDRVRFISAGEVHSSRLQVFSLNGTQVFDSGVRLGNLIEWKLCDLQGSPLGSGAYLYLVTIKDFSDRATQKFGVAQIEPDQVYLERSTMDSLPLAQAAALENNKQAEVISSIDRVGVAAMNRIVTASTGSDGIGGGKNATANAATDGAPDVRPEVAGTGTTNFLPKWTDNMGTLADSPVFTTFDRIGIGTINPGAKFHVVGLQGSIGAGTFQLNTSTPFSAFTAAYPAFEVVNTDLTDNNVSLFQFADAPSGASHAGIGAVATNHMNKFGDIFFYTKQPADGYKIRMGIFGSNVGIGTTAPAFKLHVFDSSNSGLRVETVATGGTLASFGGNGDFQIDGVGIPGGRFEVLQNGRVGIGMPLFTLPAFKLHVIDSGNTGVRVQTNSAGGTVASFGGNGDFQIDATGIPSGRLVVKENGNVGLGNPNPPERLNVNGNVSLLLAGGGDTAVSQNSVSFRLAVCSSSFRYKANISPFGSGLNLIKHLSPITFTWKQGGRKDLGLGAEDVEKVEPLLVTYNGKGEVEGVKYDRLAVALINAVKEQQTQIDTVAGHLLEQKHQNDFLQKRLNQQSKIIKKQQVELTALRSRVLTTRRLKSVSRRIN